MNMNDQRAQIEAELSAAWRALTPEQQVEALLEERAIDRWARERARKRCHDETAARLGLELVRQARAPDTNQ